MTKYVLIYTDFGDTCDGLARVNGVYDTLEKAQKAMDNDVNNYMSENNLEDEALTESDYTHTLVGDELNGCQWQILELEIIQ